MAREGLSELRFAARLRDVIRRIVVVELEKLAPRPSYAQVKVIDRTNRKCQVLFPGGTDPTDRVTISMGSVQPNVTGQWVRIEGPLGDRYITAVLGAAFYA